MRKNEFPNNDEISLGFSCIPVKKLHGNFQLPDAENFLRLMKNNVSTPSLKN
jgi:hypothetical protein